MKFIYASTNRNGIQYVLQRDGKVEIIGAIEKGKTTILSDGSKVKSTTVRFDFGRLSTSDYLIFVNNQLITNSIQDDSSHSDFLPYLFDVIKNSTNKKMNEVIADIVEIYVIYSLGFLRP